MQTQDRKPLWLRRFYACQRGASALEFALAAPAFIFFVAGIIEIAMIMLVSVLAEGGIREAARFGITGQDPNGMTREERLVEIIQEHTHGLIDVSAENVSFKVYGDYTYIGAEEPYVDANANSQYDAGEDYTDWNDNGEWDSDTGEDGSGGSGDIVLYEVTYTYRFMTPLFSVFGGEDGALDLNATVAVRNEPYDVSGGAS